MGLYLHAKHYVSSIILTSFRLGVGEFYTHTSPHTPQNKPLKNPPRLRLNLHHKNSNSFLLVNATKTYQFKAKYSEYKMSLYLGNISGDFSANNMEKNWMKWVCVQFFC